jgi:hypothetical protein
VEAMMEFQLQVPHLQRLQAGAHAHAAAAAELVSLSSSTQAARDAAAEVTGGMPVTPILQQLPPVKLATRAHDSPRSIASPASPSSPSSRSDDAASDTDGGRSTLLVWPHPG